MTLNLGAGFCRASDSQFAFGSRYEYACRNTLAPETALLY